MTAPVTVTALLPCPFCGGEARLWPVIMPFDADCDSITVQCSECDVIGADVLVDQDVHGPWDLPDLEAEAIAAWNTRTQSAAASDAQIAELREALDSIDVWLSDTLSGRVQPDPATYKQWLIDAIVEARGRARKALTHAKSSSDGEGV